MSHYQSRLAMTWAHRECKRLRVISGRPYRDLFADCLRAAWAEVKADPVVAEAVKMFAERKAQRQRGRSLSIMKRNSRTAQYMAACW